MVLIKGLFYKVYIVIKKLQVIFIYLTKMCGVHEEKDSIATRMVVRGGPW